MSEYIDWDSLETHASSNSGKHRLCYKQLGDIFENTIFYTYDSQNRVRGLIIRHPDSGKTYDIPPSTKGFEISIRNSPEPGKRDLSISISKEEYNDIFETFADNLYRILSSISRKDDIVEITIRHLLKWMLFLERISSDKLSDAQQQGLYGELYFIYNTLIPAVGVKEAISAWYGPEKQQQDFQFQGSVGVEIKTSATKSPTTLHIASEKQLDPAGFSVLFLRYIEVVKTKDNKNTLNDIVDCISSACSEYPDVSELFSRKLTFCNYRLKDRDFYSGISYSVTEERTYHVSDDFPNITKKDLKDGVCEVKYSLLTAVLGDFLYDNTDFVEILKEGYVI